MNMYSLHVHIWCTSGFLKSCSPVARLNSQVLRQGEVFASGSHVLVVVSRGHLGSWVLGPRHPPGHELSDPPLVSAPNLSLCKETKKGKEREREGEHRVEDYWDWTALSFWGWEVPRDGARSRLVPGVLPLLRVWSAEAFATLRWRKHPGQRCLVIRINRSHNQQILEQAMYFWGIQFWSPPTNQRHTNQPTVPSIKQLPNLKDIGWLNLYWIDVALSGPGKHSLMAGSDGLWPQHRLQGIRITCQANNLNHCNQYIMFSYCFSISFSYHPQVCLTSWSSGTCFGQVSTAPNSAPKPYRITRISSAWEVLS